MDFNAPNFWDLLIGLVLTVVSGWIGARLALDGEKRAAKRDQLADDRAIGRAFADRLGHQLHDWFQSFMHADDYDPFIGEDEAARVRSFIEAARADFPTSQHPVVDWASGYVEAFLASYPPGYNIVAAARYYMMRDRGEEILAKLTEYSAGRRDERWFVGMSTASARG